MDSPDNGGVIRSRAMYDAVRNQRNAAADALAEQIGVIAQINAEWQARWSDVEALRARIAEIELAARPDRPEITIAMLEAGMTEYMRYISKVEQGELVLAEMLKSIYLAMLKESIIVKDDGV